MVDWIHNNEVMLWWLAVISAALFLITLFALPFLVALIPEDYFAQDRRRPLRKTIPYTFLQVLIVVFKNVSGFVLIVAGIIMLVIPGQGLLTIFVGFMLTDFPGKYAVERWIIQRAAVRRVVVWLRAKAGHPPLKFHKTEVPAKES